MLTDSLIAIFTRDLNKLKTEVEAYKKEEILWQTEAGIANSAGNLCLHLVGNINHFIGATLGNTGYQRDRPLEFSMKDVSSATLLQQITDTIPVVENTLRKLTAADLAADFPIVVFEKPTSTEYMLVHLATHLAYHLGQINYHRRLLDV